MHSIGQSPRRWFAARMAQLPGMAALLAAVVIAGGCVAGEGATTGTARTPGTVEMAGTTGTTAATATAAEAAPVENAAATEKAKRVAMEERAGGVDLQSRAEPTSASETTMTADTKLEEVIANIDASREWVGRRFASIVDTADKAFGEPRVEDAEQIVRAKIGLRAKVFQTEDTEWRVPSNFRIPLPALARRANIFIDLATDSDTNNLSDVNAVTDDGNSSLSAAFLKKITDNLDIGVTFDVYGGWDLGPKVKLRYNKRGDPWGVFVEQQVFVRTDDGWGGRTSINVDYELSDKASFIRWANRADYYAELYGRGYKSSVIYRRKFYVNTALSAEVGMEYNPYTGDPEIKHASGPDPDNDHAYVRARIIGKIFRSWIEWELMPGYYYKWEQDEPWRWGIEARLSLIYESYLGGGYAE